MVTLDTLTPVTRSFAAQRQRLRDNTIRTAGLLWGQLVDGPSDTSAAAFADEFAPLREAYLVETAVLTDAYMDTWLEQQGRLPGDGIDPEAIAAAVRPGVAHTDVGMRPVKTVRKALSDGAPLGRALLQGRQRLSNLVATDQQQGYRIGMRDRMRSEGIRTYRRSTASSEPCAMCVIASTQRYFSDRLAPIHPGCHCIVEPILGDARSQVMQQVVDQDVLDDLKRTLDEEGVSYGDRAALANTRVTLNVRSIDDVTEVPHGELGPILSVRQHRHTDLDDLPSWVRRSRREFAPRGRSFTDAQRKREQLIDRATS